MKRLAGIALKLLVSVGLVAFLLTRIDLVSVHEAFAGMASHWFAVAVVLFAASNVLGAVQWHLLLRAQDLEVRFRSALTSYFVGVFFNNLLLGNIGGDAVRVLDIRRLTGQASGGVAATLMDRFIGLLSTCTLALIAYPLIADPRRAWLVSALVPVWLGLVVLLCMGLSRRIGAFLEGLVTRLAPAVVADLVARLRRSIVVYRERARLLAGLFALSLVVQLCRILVYWAAGLALGMDPGMIYFVCFQPVAAILAALPISVGGLGVREGALVALFTGAGISRELSLAMSVLGYVAGILGSLLGGVAFVARRLEPSPSSGGEP
ncbi:MAG: lysylphosphatidylglycerol synthase transmembrane domain-containing protein [Candidatus Latescibacterota bacterium]